MLPMLRNKFKLIDGGKPGPKILLIEPYYGGTHRKLMDTITSFLAEDLYTLVTITPKKWHWRARTSALYISTRIPRVHNYLLLFCSSVLPLAELIGLRPDLAKVHKIVFFHENQLEYPMRSPRTLRDFQYGYNEILSCLTANQVMFNTKHNMNTFLNHIPSHLRSQLDYRSRLVTPVFENKASVVYYPINVTLMDAALADPNKNMRKELIIVWPHRWEYDKNPMAFYSVIRKLDADGLQFKVCLLGESYSQKPSIFNSMDAEFKAKRVLHCGFVPDDLDYYALLKKADVVVSTAIQDYFGVAIMEAVYCGCIPVVPKRLAYKELYAAQVKEMYSTDQELYYVLRGLCQKKREGTLLHNYTKVALKHAAETWFGRVLDLIEARFTYTRRPI